MRKQRRTFTEQFKRDAVRVMMNRGTRTIREVARSLGVSNSMLNRWYQEYGDQVAPNRGHSQQSSAEDVEELRRRLRQLEQENELLKKAAAFFAKGNL